MDFEAQKYRAETAESLKAKDKKDRIFALQSLRTDHREPDKYYWARYDHALEVNEGLMEKRIAEIVSQAASLEDLKNQLEKAELLVFNDVNGIDHGEHLSKQVELAEVTGCVPIVPKVGGLAEKVEKLLRSSGREIHGSIDKREYNAFLEARFPDLGLTQRELDRITDKLPPEAFVSIDRPIEQLTILLNALEGTKTKYSCAGHAERSEFVPTSEGYFSFAYCSFVSKNGALLQDLKKEFAGHPAVSFDEEEKNEGDAADEGEKMALHFNQYPPQEWLVKHGKRSRQEINSDCIKAFAFASKMQIPEDIEEKKYMNMLYLFQATYLKDHPEAALRFAPGNRLIREFKMYMPWMRESEEYADFNLSDEAREARDDFLHTAESVVYRHRTVD